jgi:iodotyrosine deiodinase
MAQFESLQFRCLPREVSAQKAREFFEEMRLRRSVRAFSAEPVPREWIELAVRTAGSAPSGANCQPWHFVAVADPAVKARIRAAAEAEERKNYASRMPEEWLEELRQVGTDWHKSFLERAPWLVVVFAESYRVSETGAKRKNYYVQESVGIACGLFIAAIHQMGLATLTHTPSPMGFLGKILQRPPNERAFMLFPVGFPADDATVPVLAKKDLEDISTWLTEPDSGR